MGQVTRFRGSLCDCVTGVEIPFQYEPRIESESSTQFSNQSIIGRRLINRQWIGGGDGSMSIEFVLVGSASEPKGPSVKDVESIRAQQRAAVPTKPQYVWVPSHMEGPQYVRGHYGPNPEYNPKYVDGKLNPNYKDPVENYDTVRNRLKDQAANDDKFVKNRILALNSLLDPQGDTGAPHPVWVNMGGMYTGRRFLVNKVKVDVTVTNYNTLEPTEAHVSLQLIEIAAPTSLSTGNSMPSLKSPTMPAPPVPPSQG